MAISDMIPTMDDQGLANLRGNAERLASSGNPRQRAEAEGLLPLIMTELETRRAARPTRVVRAKPATAKKAPPPRRRRPEVEPEAREENGFDEF